MKRAMFFQARKFFVFVWPNFWLAILFAWLILCKSIVLQAYTRGNKEFVKYLPHPGIKSVDLTRKSRTYKQWCANLRVPSLVSNGGTNFQTHFQLWDQLSWYLVALWCRFKALRSDNFSSRCSPASIKKKYDDSLWSDLPNNLGASGTATCKSWK